MLVSNSLELIDSDAILSVVDTLLNAV